MLTSTSFSSWPAGRLQRLAMAEKAGTGDGAIADVDSFALWSSARRVSKGLVGIEFVGSVFVLEPIGQEYMRPEIVGMKIIVIDFGSCVQ